MLYTLLSGLGLFLGNSLSSPYLILWACGFLFLVSAVSYRSFFRNEPLPGFELLILGIIGINFLVQLTGGTSSPFYPAYFLIAAAATFQPGLRAYALVGLIVAIEACNSLLSNHDAARWPVIAGHGFALAGVVVIITPFTDRIRNQARTAQERYRKLLADADAVDPLADALTVDTLFEQYRQAVNISTAVEREEQFSGLITMIHGLAPAHTYALFLAEREGNVFVLRAIKSENRNVALPGTARITKGSGLIGLGIEEKQPRYLRDIVVPGGNLGYYTREIPVRSILAVPILHNGRMEGLLVVDSLEPDAFSPGDQELLLHFGPFFGQIIEKIRISQELDLRAANFKALHQMSSVLSSSLEIGQVLDTLSSQILAVVPYDFCAFLHYDERSGKAVITALRGYNKSSIGSRFPVEQSAILAHMLKQWQERSFSGVHYDPDLGARGKEISLFPMKEMQKQMQSLYGRPLIARSKFVGATFLGSVRPNAFSEYHRHFLDTLLNQVAAVVDNSVMHQNMIDMARTDGLTGLLNHRTFMEKLAEESRRIDREGRPFSVLLMDIDRFKTVNDTFGHPVGDLAIKAVSKVLRDAARATDFVARYGGEEFAVGMVDTNSKGAEQMAERVRSIMQKTVVTRIGGKELKITLSIGVASSPQDSRTTADLVTLADAALYHAKRSGRNRVCLVKEIDDSHVKGIPRFPARH